MNIGELIQGKDGYTWFVCALDPLTLVRRHDGKVWREDYEDEIPVSVLPLLDVEDPVVDAPGDVSVVIARLQRQIKNRFWEHYSGRKQT